MVSKDEREGEGWTGIDPRPIIEEAQDMVRATVRKTATGFQLDLDPSATEDTGFRDGIQVFVIRGDDAVVEIVPVESERGKVVAAYERIEEKSRAEAKRLAGR